MMIGQVAKVISAYEVAFDKGSDDGVVWDQIATIHKEIAIPDPGGGDPLGAVQRPMIRFKIIEVKPSFSVGETFDVVTEEGDDTTSWAAVARLIAGKRKRVTTLEYEEDYRTVYVEAGMEVKFESEVVDEVD